MKRWVRRMLPAMLRLGTALGDGNQFAEGFGVANRQIGEHLSIDVDAGQLCVLPVPAGALGAEEVTLLRGRAHDLAGLRHPESFGRRAMGTEFRHRTLL